MVALSLGHKVISIDANDTYNHFITSSIQANGFDTNRICIMNILIDDTSTPILFDGSTTNTKLQNVNSTKEVATYKLVDIIPKGCKLLRVDVSGGEPNVLKSTGPLLFNGSIPYILLTIPLIINKRVDRFQVEMLVQLCKYDYTVYELSGENVEKIEDLDIRLGCWIQNYKQGESVGLVKVLAVHANELKYNRIFG